jgi:ParB/RepB/Spo0J family partition protein
MTVKKVSIDLVDPNPFQVRDKKSMALSAESIKTLAAEMKERGVWEHALRARKNGRRYELCFGHRRLAAMKRLGIRRVLVDVVDLNDDEMATDTLVENFQRNSLADGEKRKAWALLKTIELERNKKGATERAAKLLGISGRTAASLNKATSKTYANPKSAALQISAAALAQADTLGEIADQGKGPEMVETAANLKIGQQQLMQITTAINKYEHKTVRAKLAKEAIKGNIETVKDVEKAKRKIDKETVERLKKKVAGGEDIPQDLTEVVRQWNKDLPEIIEKLELVASQTMYADYIADRAPAIAAKFRENLLRLKVAAATIAKRILPRLEA